MPPQNPGIKKNTERIKKVGSVKENNYSLENDVLTIHTECGEFKFKIDGDTGRTKARQIAELMVGEMSKVEKLPGCAKEKTSPYARLLMSTLNIADKYVRLEQEYNQLLFEQEKKKARTPAPSAPPVPEKPVLPGQKTAPPPSAQTAAPPAPKPDMTRPDTARPDAARPDITKSRATESATPEPALPKTEHPQPEPPKKAEQDKRAEQPETPAPSPVIEKKKETVPAAQAATQPGPLVKQVLENLKKTEAKPEARPEISPGTKPAPDAEIKPATKPETKSAPDTQAVPKTDAGLKINSRIPAQTPGKEALQTGRDAFNLPSLTFLNKADQDVAVDHETIRRDAELLEQKLGYFGIKGEVMEVSPGPVITTFEYRPAPGIKISKIVNLADDLALALSALSIRIVAPIPGKDVIGIEIPNPRMSIVPFIDIAGSKAFKGIDSSTPICLGKDIIGNPVVVGLEKMPHLLIAGATGTGKSVALNAMIASILYKSRPDQVKFIMIDPKRIELSLFNDIPHLLTPVITDMKKANIALQWVVREMERRYEKLATLQVRNIEQYNRKIKTADLSKYEEEEPFEHFPYIVVIIDELADLMMTASKDIEFSLTRIAQMARAAGIHLILATQRPSVDVLTGIIKANFPTRISFQVSSKTDSRTIIDANGAETLLGRGDMLFVPPGTARLTRVHGTYLSEEELLTITNHIKAQGKPDYVLDVVTEKDVEPSAIEVDEDGYDEKYQAALDFVLSSRQASISSVQRALRVGYNRAARIIDLMEKKGIVSASDGVKPRQVLVDRVD
ncbi:MAG TPA: DNA translocase FtsK [Desulfobacteraceae bacterium]|nr:DNA translocase FtsK [Desulfobacteraceae bacterium]